MKLFINFILSAVIAFGAIEFLPGLHADSYWIVTFIALILGVINVSVRPLLEISSVIPTFITIIIAIFLLSGAVVVLAEWTIEGFTNEGLGYVALFSAVVAVLNWGVHRLVWK
ncbi:MAG: phage holin family protein [Bacteroidaceae bacterium]